jgi:hypothetical protein
MSSAVRAGIPAFGLPGRIQSPNSRPRSIALVGLVPGGAAIARRVATESDLATIEVQDADMTFLVACPGDDLELAARVSSIAHSRNHPVTALYIVPEDSTGGGEDATLKTLRAAVEMLVVVSDESYVPAMVAALGA